MDSSTRLMVKKKSKSIGLLFLPGFLVLAGCQKVSSPSAPLAARALVLEYERSSADTRTQYDGKEITVIGSALVVPSLPRGGDDQGSVFLAEKELAVQRRVTCWFSRSQAEQFSQIKVGQVITVKGVFNGEAGLDLKFCRLVKAE